MMLSSMRRRRKRFGAALATGGATGAGRWRQRRGKLRSAGVGRRAGAGSGAEGGGDWMHGGGPQGA